MLSFTFVCNAENPRCWLRNKHLTKAVESEVNRPRDWHDVFAILIKEGFVVFKFFFVYFIIIGARNVACCTDYSLNPKPRFLCIAPFPLNGWFSSKWKLRLLCLQTDPLRNWPRRKQYEFLNFNLHVQVSVKMTQFMEQIILEYVPNLFSFFHPPSPEPLALRLSNLIKSLPPLLPPH